MKNQILGCHVVCRGDANAWSLWTKGLCNLRWVSLYFTTFASRSFHIFFLTDQMNDYMAPFQLLGRYFRQISNLIWQRVTNNACALHTPQFGLTSASYEEILYNWASFEDKWNPLKDEWASSEDKWASSEENLAPLWENWAPSPEANSTDLCDYRSCSELRGGLDCRVHCPQNI